MIGVMLPLWTVPTVAWAVITAYAFGPDLANRVLNARGGEPSAQPDGNSSAARAECSGPRRLPDHPPQERVEP